MSQEFFAEVTEPIREASSVRPSEFDLNLLAESLQRVESALGADPYEALLRRDAETSWDDLSLVHG